MTKNRAKYREKLPQLTNKLFLTDAGMETFLIFHKGIDIPHFASFDLMKSEEGTAQVRDYYASFAALASDKRLGFVFEAPTWRANRDWGAKLGYDATTLAAMNCSAIALMAEIRAEYETPESPMAISGNIGPRGDGYRAEAIMNAKEAEDYHAEQIGVFRDTAADFVSAFTINYVAEAIGVARAAKAADMPCVISFTLETDGRLPTGQSLRSAIEETDAATGRAPAYYMINCAHPAHFEDILNTGETWTGRLRGLRANASTRSHAELDEATDLDDGSPPLLGLQYRALRRKLPHITVLGGCCGTDYRHVEQICFACTEPERGADGSPPRRMAR